MEMGPPLHDLIEDLRRESIQPEILGERCVHAIIDNASCRSCVDICPHHAWQLDEAVLGLDTEACDGCGLCVPGCGQGAIQLHWEIPQGVWHGIRLALLTCERTGAPRTQGAIPCVHAIGLRELLGLLRQGVERLVVNAADCDSCERGRGLRLADRVQDLNHSLQVSGQSGLSLRDCHRGTWQRLYAELSEQPPGEQVDRRGFLSGLLSQGLRQGLARVGLHEPADAPFTPPGHALPAPTPETLWPHLPAIDATCCNGCDACARLCPQGAIDLQQTKEGLSYRLAPKECTGCGICVDVCDRGAVELSEWAPQRQLELPLSQARCRSCGSEFHLPAHGAQSGDGRCRICSIRDHQSRLFQVLD